MLNCTGCASVCAAEQLILLDVQPLMSASVLIDRERNGVPPPPTPHSQSSGSTGGGKKGGGGGNMSSFAAHANHLEIESLSLLV